VESYRTTRGPRQRVVAYLGNISQSEGEGIKQAAERKTGAWQSRLFDAEGQPEWDEVDTKRIKVGRVRDFGGYWLGLQILEKLKLVSFFESKIPRGLESLPANFLWHFLFLVACTKQLIWSLVWYADVFLGGFGLYPSGASNQVIKELRKMIVIKCCSSPKTGVL
jgi:hypothetical protein